MKPKLSHTALADLAEAIALLAIVLVLIAQHVLGQKFLAPDVEQSLGGGLAMLTTMFAWRLGVRVGPTPPPAGTRPRTPRARGNTIIRNRGVLLAVALAIAGCGATGHAIRDQAKTTAAQVASCAVEQAAACAPETSALAGCVFEHGFHCAPERIAWADCLKPRAIACGTQAVITLASGLDDPTGVPVTCIDRAIDDCWQDAGDTAALEACIATRVEPCVD